MEIISRNILFGVVCLLPAFILGCMTDDAQGQHAPSTAPVDSASAFAVVELFTSEGCSSCPPADLLLGKLAGGKNPAGRVVTIAYHVDYWDSLGWRDRFDDPAYSARQRDYARTFGLTSIYTPQMIVNGQREFAGSNAAAAGEAIAAALRLPPKVGVSINLEPAAAGKLRITWKTTGAAAGETLRVVLTESGLSTAVKNGENAGRQLHHESVARAMSSQPLSEPDSSGTAELTIGKEVNLAKASIVAFIQRDADMAILGAATASVAASR